MRIPAPNPAPVLPPYPGASSLLLPAPPAQMARRDGSVLSQTWISSTSLLKISLYGNQPVLFLPHAQSLSVLKSDFRDVLKAQTGYLPFPKLYLIYSLPEVFS